MIAISKDTLGCISIGFAIVSYVPYIRGILKGRFRAHVFSWLVWTVSTLVVFAAQWTEGGGAGAALLTAMLLWRRRAQKHEGRGA